MSTFSYSSGNPANLTGGSTANMNDIQGPFTDLRTFLNGNNIDAAANIAHGVFIAYRTVAQVGWALTAGTGAGTSITKADGSCVLNGNPSVGPYVIVIPIDGAAWATTGLTAKLRVRAVTTTNATAPTGNFTFGLHAVTAMAGAALEQRVTINGTAVSGSTVTRSAPALGSTFDDASADFDVPTTGRYCLCVVNSATLAANSQTTGFVALELHHI